MNKFPWKSLLKWYQSEGRHTLPWRQYADDNNNIYHIWISEILLQQTQVERVIPYFKRILEKYPTIKDLAGASYEEFFPYYQGMGYYSRARNILKTARIISHEYSGIFPQEKKVLKALPGIGEYTSHAILAFGYGFPVLTWDTNLEKVFARYYHGEKTKKLTEIEKQEVEQDLQLYIHEETQGIYNPKYIRAINNALMDFSAMKDLKSPGKIEWEGYPIKSGMFYETRGTLEKEEKKGGNTFPVPDAQILIILHQDHKIYYSQVTRDMSESQARYQPFIIAPALERDTRKYIQNYFRNNYNIELSVRPIHKKWFSKDGIPYVAVNAQIQIGDVSVFKTFSKKETKEILEEI